VLTLTDHSVSDRGPVETVLASCMVVLARRHHGFSTKLHVVNVLGAVRISWEKAARGRAHEKLRIEVLLEAGQLAGPLSATRRDAHTAAPAAARTQQQEQHEGFRDDERHGVRS
jgi:hypothetical protein